MKFIVYKRFLLGHCFRIFTAAIAVMAIIPLLTTTYTTTVMFTVCTSITVIHLLPCSRNFLWVRNQVLDLSLDGLLILLSLLSPLDRLWWC